MPGDKLLSIENLSVEFNSGGETVHALQQISFELYQGETIGIVGESGSGKSVTSMSIMGLIPPTQGKISGNILYNNAHQQTVNLTQLSDKEMNGYRGNEIAMIFQEPMTSLNPVYTCGNQVTEAIRTHQNISNKAAKDYAIQLFNEVRLPRPESIYNSYPHQISGGQKQRVMIAMAISCNPRILIADEPTTALDVTVQKNILELLHDIQQKHKMGILFITHDLGVVSHLADKILVMYKGEIVEQGEKKQILESPQHPYTKGLLACRPATDKRLRILPTVSDFLNHTNEALQTEVISAEERKQTHQQLYEQQPILKVKDVQKYYTSKHGEVKAVDDVSFDVYPGETLGLVGESGCGKTTLGRMILNLIKTDKGSILFQDIDLANINRSALRALRKEIQIIFQDPYSSLNPRMTIGESLKEPMMVHNILQNDAARKARVLELLETVGLEKSHYMRYPHEFSGGQRQRICIARALTLNPKFIVCDESVSALDVSVQAQILNLLNKLKHDFGFTYIFISHDLSVVKYFSDKVIVMNKGKIEEYGEADALYASPTKEYTKKLIESIPVA